jgi:hypothetical protein
VRAGYLMLGKDFLTFLILDGEKQLAIRMISAHSLLAIDVRASVLVLRH